MKLIWLQLLCLNTLVNLSTKEGETAYDRKLFKAQNEPSKAD